MWNSLILFLLCSVWYPLPWYQRVFLLQFASLLSILPERAFSCSCLRHTPAADFRSTITILEFFFLVHCHNPAFSYHMQQQLFVYHISWNGKTFFCFLYGTRSFTRLVLSKDKMSPPTHRAVSLISNSLHTWRYENYCSPAFHCSIESFSVIDFIFIPTNFKDISHIKANEDAPSSGVSSRNFLLYQFKVH